MMSTIAAVETKVPPGVLGMLGKIAKRPGAKQRFVPRCVGWALARKLIKHTKELGTYDLTGAGKIALRKGTIKEAIPA